MGLIPVVISLQKKFINVSFVTLAIGILASYEIALKLGLEDWIINSERTNLLNMNREGIFSFLGYYSIFLLAADLGNRLFKATDWKSGLMILIKDGLISLVFSWNSYHNGIQVSRRMANMHYVLWIYSLCVFAITCIGIVELILPSSFPQIIQAINRNQLFVFLVANVITGLVNLNIDTLNQHDLSAFLILSCYVIGVSIVALAVRNLKILRF